jgi:ATP-dependent Lhr-like helicase
VFNKLAPFIQEYIYHHEWSELRPIQIAACQIIFETDAHLLLAAGTASGKTEAAFLPVLTLLAENPATSIGVLYIGPIKALINDQFERLNDLLKEADIPVYHWHGDVSQSPKKQVLQTPRGILQITPESLESLLINKNNELHRLFGDLRFVIIDEVHAFMGSDRGCQVLCQLARLGKVVKKEPRRIGLSATLGDFSLAEGWLGSGSEKGVITPQVEGVKRRIFLGVECFNRHSEGETRRVLDAKGAKGGEGGQGEIFHRVSEFSDYEKYIFNITKSRKCLIFANSRSQTELVVASLREIAKSEGFPDVYHVHHGSISAKLREAAEKAMREPNFPAVTAATLTLELGIDIGYLERVIQLDAPLCVASFLQRLGRAGRRGEAADMRFVCAENEILGDESIPECIPWQLLQCIAIIQLYLEEKWIEPIKPVQYPLSLLYHQTMSILATLGEVSPAALAKQVLSLPVFGNISREDFKRLLRYLIDINHIQKTETSKLILGLAGERVVNKFQFYAVFPDNEEYVVKEAAQEIGSINAPLAVGNQFGLAGRSWEVLEVDLKKRTVFVKQVEGKASISWRGGSGNIHSRVLQRMHQVLLEDLEYSYLQKNAVKRLQECRQLARVYGLDKNNILELEAGSYCIFPWMGTVAYRTLIRLLNFFCRETWEIKSIGGVNPYFLTVKLGKNNFQDFIAEIKQWCSSNITEQDLVATAEAPQIQKYDEFVPPELLRQAFIKDYLDLGELRQRIM